MSFASFSAAPAGHIMLHGFQKKTPPKQILDLAEERMKTLLQTEASKKTEKPESKPKKRKRR
jgi:phage-related protein